METPLPATPEGNSLNGLPLPIKKETTLAFGRVMDKAALSYAVLVLGTGLGWLIPVPFWWAVIPAAVVAVFLGILAHGGMKERATAASVLSFSLLLGVTLGGVSHAVDSFAPGLMYQMVVVALCVMGVILVLCKMDALIVEMPRNLAWFLPVIGYAVFALLSAGLKHFGLVSDPWGMHGLLWGHVSIALVTGIVIAIMSAIFTSMTVAELDDAVEQKASGDELWEKVFLFSFSLVWMYWELLKILAMIAYSFGDC